MSESICSYIFLKAITENEVVKEINNLKVNESGGYDETSPKIVRATSENIVQPLVQIYNWSFLTGIIPDELKIAAVIPTFKLGDFNLNYRPMSVLSSFSKILEKVMYKRMWECEMWDLVKFESTLLFTGF